MAEQNIAFLSATELGNAIREKQISPVEAVEAYLAVSYTHLTLPTKA